MHQVTILIEGKICLISPEDVFLAFDLIVNGKIAKKLEISLSTVKMYCQRAQKGNIILIERIVGDNFALLREMLEPLCCLLYTSPSPRD